MGNMSTIQKAMAQYVSWLPSSKADLGLVRQHKILEHILHAAL